MRNWYTSEGGDGLDIVMVCERFLPDAFGGGEVSSYLLARTLATKHDVTVFTAGDGRREEMDGFTVRRTIPPPSGKWPEDLRRGEVLTLATLRGLLGSFKGADILHVHGIRTSVGAVLASRLRGIPAVATINDSWATCYYSLHFKDGERCMECSPRKFRECLERYGGQPAAMPYLATSMRERLYFISKFDGLMPHSSAMMGILRKHGVDCRMEVVPPIIDTDLFSSKKPPEEFTLGFVGRIDDGKGLDDAIRVAARTGYRMRVVGNGPALEGCRKLASRLEGGDLVEFVGRVPYKEVPAEYHRASLVLAPFKRVEPIGRVLMEANSCGRGVITTSICGGSERLEDGRNGYVLEPGDVDGFERVVNEVASDPDLARELGINGRKFVEENHAPDVILERTEGFYRKIIEDQGG